MVRDIPNKSVMRKFISRKSIYLILFLFLFIGSGSPQFFYKNSGTSLSFGKVNAGKIENAWLLPYNKDNYKSFSFISYYLLGRAYVNSNVYKTVDESFKIMTRSKPEIKFRYMECSKKRGGRMRPHRTHQNGLSIDFMTPLIKHEKPKKFYDRIGIFRYLMNFDESGKANINSNVSIDFETIALHILTLEKVGRKNGIRIKKVIINTNLKDDLFSTKYGDQLKQSGIYFVRNLTPQLNKLHDDHYHIDFEIIK